jgi:hypothetical protein
MLVIVSSSTKYFVPGQEGKGKPLLYFHRNTVHFYIIDGYIYFSNNKKGMYCCLPVATVVKRKYHNVTLFNFFYPIFIMCR